MKLIRLFFFLLISIIVVADNGGNQIIGTWVNSTGEAHIEVYSTNSKYFGKIAWLKEPLDEKGKPKTDGHNPKEELKKRPVLGLVLLTNFNYIGDNKWEDGEIYDPKNGKSYSCNMTLKDASTLEIRGYIGISLIGRTEVWKRKK